MRLVFVARPDLGNLAGPDAYATAAWYEAVTEAAIPPGCEPLFLAAGPQDAPVAIIPLLGSRAGYASLTTPYSCLWHPLLSPGLGADELNGLGEGFGRLCKKSAVTRLDAIDADASWLAPFLAGARRSGLLPLRFDHFGNWHAKTAGLGWSGYLAQRPGKLRETIRRRTRRLMEMPGATFDIVDGITGLDAALRAYADVYARSWKAPEPFARFIPALARACAGDGSLRLGVLRLGGEPIAVQLWMVRNGWAGVQKLAHDEARKHLAPGTVLTGLMIRHLLDNEHIEELDFGRGDDAYKQDWTGLRRQRIGVLLVNPLSVRGLAVLMRHQLGHLIRRCLRSGPAQDIGPQYSPGRFAP